MEALLWQWRATGLDGNKVMAPSTIPTPRKTQPQAPSFQHMYKHVMGLSSLFPACAGEKVWLSVVDYVTEIIGQETTRAEQIHAAQSLVAQLEKFNWHSDFSKAPQ